MPGSERMYISIHPEGCWVYHNVTLAYKVSICLVFYEAGSHYIAQTWVYNPLPLASSVLGFSGCYLVSSMCTTKLAQYRMCHHAGSNTVCTTMLAEYCVCTTVLAQYRVSH